MKSQTIEALSRPQPSTVDTLVLQMANYEDVFPLWRERLWPQRQDPICSMSSMLWDGGFDEEIYSRFHPTFWVFRDEGSIIACNSGHLTSIEHYRSRGLYVEPDWRGRGLGLRLLQAAEAQARTQGAKLIWSYPRINALSVYRAAGFHETERKLFANDANLYAAKRLAQSS